MIDILVPVLGRPQNVQPLMESVAVTHNPYRVIFICSPLDTEQIHACQSSEAETLIVNWHPGRGDFAKKINWAFERTEAEWVFQGADDIRFRPGWDSKALLHARKLQKRVIGTNDLHNPAVRRRIHSTHTLFARSYIEEHGGTLDDTGKVFCELYDHQFVDTEFIVIARKRNEWTFCVRAVVEHFHPHWGNAEWDETYRKSLRETREDFRLYRERMGPHIHTARTQRSLEREERRRLAKTGRRRG